jgi:hypothetical protein
MVLNDVDAGQVAGQRLVLCGGYTSPLALRPLDTHEEHHLRLAALVRQVDRRRDQPPEFTRRPLIPGSPRRRQQPLGRDPAVGRLHLLSDQIADRIVVVTTRAAVRRLAAGPSAVRCA